MAEAAEETPTKKSVRFAEEDEEHPISPRAAPKPDADLLQGILKNAGLEGIVDAAAMDVGEDESDSSLPKGKKPAVSEEGEEMTQREADAHDKEDVDRIADRGMSRVQHDVDEDSGGSDDDEGRAGASKYDVLDTTNIDGVEARTMDYNEAGIKITPFNLEEEEEEGHFDKDGNFVWDKEQEGGDAWLESVDWNKEVPGDFKTSVERIEEGGDEVEEVSQRDQLDRLLSIMQPGETLAKTLKRLGGGGASGARKWQKKKAGAEANAAPRDTEGIATVTDAADKLLQSGYHDVYSSTYEQLKAYRDNEAATGMSRIVIKRGLDSESDSESEGGESKKKKKKRAKTEEEEKPQPAAAKDAGLDMYGDDDEETNKGEAGTSAGNGASSGGAAVDDAVMWEYKWANGGEGGEVYGPYTSETMRDWKEGGMFAAGIMVRKVGESNFYSGARIDFDLYT